MKGGGGVLNSSLRKLWSALLRNSCAKTETQDGKHETVCQVVEWCNMCSDENTTILLVISLKTKTHWAGLLQSACFSHMFNSVQNTAASVFWCISNFTIKDLPSILLASVLPYMYMHLSPTGLLFIWWFETYGEWWETRFNPWRFSWWEADPTQL